MSLRISFDLHDADLRHFEELAQQTQSLERRRSAESIIAAARDVLANGERAHLAEFVKERFSRLRAMLEMATDADWKVSGEDQQRIVNALGCFSVAPQANGEPATAGLLDRAIMIELVSRDLEHDLVAYRDFCKFRESQLTRRAGREDLQRQHLEQRRDALQARMHTRRQRDLDRAGSSVRKLFSLFGL
ncbi:MAG: hypothetical protein ABW106_10895 [Steroidobacteraceae bacterium]